MSIRVAFSTLLLVYLLGPNFTIAQTLNKYFIYFSDKNNTPYSVDQPTAFLSPKALERRVKQNIPIMQRDLPVNPVYLDSLNRRGIKVLGTSKWFNAALVLTDSANIEALKSANFVVNNQKLSRIGNPQLEESNASSEMTNKNLSSISSEYGFSQNQVSMINADYMHSQGFKGKGVMVAVFDAGFPGVDTLGHFKHLHLNNQIVGTRDFVGNDDFVYEESDHGTMVLSVLGGYTPGKLVGTAYEANFLLIRSEDNKSETLYEEVNWAFAAEYADSAGADIISSSLGYSTFDQPLTDHSIGELDGITAIVSKAAGIAFETGMVVVNSAGNYAKKPWRYIAFPADSKNILSIGAVDSDKNYADFSSIGPTADGRVKPDLAAHGKGTFVLLGNGDFKPLNGTSFACPIVSGLVAGFWQAYPDLTNSMVVDFLRKSGSQYNHPDNYKGYGIPDFQKLQRLVTISNLNVKDKTLYVSPTVFSDEFPSLYVPQDPKGNFKITLYNSFGQLIKLSQINVTSNINDLGLDFNLFPPGVYSIAVEGIDNKFHQKFKVLKIRY